VLGILEHALVITGFVFVMMLVVEYLNVLTRGAIQQHLPQRRWGQLLLAVGLGITPGCLGAFVVVTLYAHRALSLGALAAAMIATSGDEAFVMLALIPSDALLVMASLLVTGVLVGAVVDRLARRWAAGPQGTLADDLSLPIHDEEICHCFPRGQILAQWKDCTAARGLLAVGLVLFELGLVSGEIGPEKWNWIRVTLVAVAAVALFIVSTVPDHFIEHHLWQHVVRRHVPRIFLWTLGALLVMWALTEWWNLEQLVKGNRWVVLLIAAAVGLVPESGPHLLFVTMYDEGLVPFATLLASSVVQDGHGMLPLLAHSRKAFFLVKGINLLAGLALGALLLTLGM
jgi:hypothetical protein